VRLTKQAANTPRRLQFWQPRVRVVLGRVHRGYQNGLKLRHHVGIVDDKGRKIVPEAESTGGIGCMCADSTAQVACLAVSIADPGSNCVQRAR